LTTVPVHPAAAFRAAEPPARLAARSLTLTKHFRTLGWTLACIGLCLALNGLEKFVAIPLGWVPRDGLHRMFKNPAEIAMRLFGFPHFIVGVLFLLTSRRMKGSKSVTELLGLAALGIGICWLFHRVGGDTNPLAVLIFYFYFLVHGFRDEVFFYKSYGEMPADAAATHQRVMWVLQALLLGFMLALLLPLTVLYGDLKENYRHPALQAIFPASWPYTVRFFSTIGPMLLIGAVALWRISRVFPDRLAGLWRVHRPIITVFITMASIIVLPIWTGGWTFQLAILFHFVGWYIFARYRLRQFPPKQPPTGLWQWMRTTPRGFAVLHMGLAAVAVVVVAINVYGYGQVGWLDEIVGRRNFYYWTIMHVTLSFFPR
jgi:hypothetical protein